MELAVRCFALCALGGAAILGADGKQHPKLLNMPRLPHALPQGQVSHRTRSFTRTMNPQDTQHEVEEMVERVKELHDENVTAEFDRELEGVEEAMAVKVRNETRLSDEIRSSRADLCTHQGFEAHEMRNCEVFMAAACPPIAPIPLVPLAFCESFFGTDPLKLHALRGASKGSAAPGAVPGPAPGPGPALFGGKRFDMLPEQGLAGKLIKHKDFETMAEDWMTEREGVNAAEICKRNPNNEWCRLHFSGSMPGDTPSSWDSKEGMEVRQASESAAAEVEYQSASGSDAGDAGGAEAGGIDKAQPATPVTDQSTRDHLRTAHVPIIASLKDFFRNPFESSSLRAHAIGAFAALFLSQLFN